jgi:dTMP kinase
VRRKGLFVTIEGVEGAGKSTNIRVIEEFLSEWKLDYILTREPGGTLIAEEIRELLLKHHEEKMDATTELLLIFAARAQHLSTKIRQTLAEGTWVLCDRFTDATYAYQGAGRGLDVKLISQLERLVQDNLRPDLTVIFDLDPSVGLERARQRGQLDRIESQKLEFFQRVREGYQNIASREGDRCLLIDASQTRETVRQSLRAALENRMQAFLGE